MVVKWQETKEETITRQSRQSLFQRVTDARQAFVRSSREAPER